MIPNRRPSQIFSGLLILATSILAGCDSSSTPKEPTGPTPVPTSIFVSTPKEVLESFGETVQLTAQVKDQNGNAMTGVSLAWSSNANGIVSVSSSGLATALANGSAIITATAGEAGGSAALTVDQKATGLAKVKGDAQEGTVGENVTVNPAVVIRDANQNPVAGVSVEFEVTSGGGAVSATLATTGSSGEAEVTWTLGTDASAIQSLRATALETSVEFTAIALPGPPAALSLLSGDEQAGYAMEALPTPLEVALVDAYENPLSGMAVEWAASAGSGTLTPAAEVTDAEGKVQAIWTLGQAAGTQTASASFSSLSPVSFSATALPNATISGTVTIQGGTLTPPASSPPSVKDYGTASGSAIETRPVEGELIVLFHPDAPTSVAAPGSSPVPGLAALQSFAAETELLATSPAISAALIRAAPGQDAGLLARRLEADPRVRLVEQNLRHPARRWSEPVVTGFPFKTASLPSLSPQQQWRMEMIGFPAAWNVTTGSSDVTVAILDDGIRFDHTGISGINASGGYDLVRSNQLNDCIAGFVDSAGDGDGPDGDPTTPQSLIWSGAPGNCVSGVNAVAGQGLFTASLIAGPSGQATVGVGPQTGIRPVRIVDVVGFFETWSLVNGILYAAGFSVDIGDNLTAQAADAAEIIHVGVGTLTNSATLEAALDQAENAGSVVVAPVGDDGLNNTMYPAGISTVIGVSAVGPTGIIASHSNLGGSVSIAAPGGDQPAGDFSFGIYSALWDFSFSTPTWGWLDGTAFAAAHVSGAAALLRAAEPGLTPAQIRARLTSHAESLTPTAWYGAGILDALASLTQGQGLPAEIHVQLFNASTGALVQTVKAGTDGSYQFSRLADGDFWVFAGEDQNGDGLVGEPRRSWGAFGGSTSPTTVTISGGGAYTASFAVATPTEVEPNNSIETANDLPIGGYQRAALDDVADMDYFRVIIPETGTYEFKTEGVGGACGFAEGANTVLNVLLPGSVLVDLNDDVDQAGLDLCSGLTVTLAAGVHYVQIAGSHTWQGRGVNQRTGGYIVWARKRD